MPDGRTLFLTYTCPVSRFTFAGHPRAGHLYEHTNDLRDAVTRIKGIALRHSQPVSWVINDQEYLNTEGLLPDLLRWQQEGDSILVTMELTTSPPGVDKTSTREVIRWIHAMCQRAGLQPDGLWSLKFFETDLAAIAALPSGEMPWTRNLAGSCWHQSGIDDSTWLGCPYNPYYPALWNVRASASPDDPKEFLMLEWLTRDIAACLSGGFPATFSLDPADANRRDAGGFSTEADALRYSVELIDESARQIAFNRMTVVNINEEARHYQTEGHDKDFMLDGMFARFASIAADPPAGVRVRQAPYADVWREWRGAFPETPESIRVCRDLDWRRGEIEGAGAYTARVPGDMSLLFQDSGIQVAFLRSRGALPVELYDYTTRVPGEDSNDPYPQSRLPRVDLREMRLEHECDGLLITLVIWSEDDYPKAPLMFWDAPVKGDETAASKDDNVGCVRATPAGLFVRVDLVRGANTASMRLTRAL